MSDVNANISVNIDTSAALGELKNLQRQISQFHNQIAKSSASATIAQRNLQQEFLNSINATGQFAARMQTIKTSAESFTNSLEKNKFSMREYFRYGVASSKNFGKVFKTEFETINKVAEERVRRLQTQYIKMGRDASGAMKAIAVTPLALDMENLGTKTMMAAQKQQLFNQLLAQGTTNLINFGKNTQWAGRQLMVGFTIPLSIFGSTASKVFMDLEKQVIRFRRVYGDLLTLPSETDANLTFIRGLAEEFTKYGVAIADTMSIAADAAAAGFQGQKLADQVKAATRLSVLGEVDKQQALSATIAIQTAFKMNSDQLAESINFLNAVENQSVVSLQNLTDAIPRVAPVIQGLGGDIKDMSVFLAAMQEGGVNAAEAANGLKSALASIINPSKAAREMLQGVNIDIDAIVSKNEGNIMRTVLNLADAMKELTPLARQRILEKLFGKFQFARVSALFDNVARSGSQAANALELVKMSSQDLAAIANKELNAIEENSATKFKAAVESLRASIAPVGEAFLKVVTPIIEFFTKIADKFNGLSDGTKKVITTLVTLFAGVGPVVLMLVGLIANFAGQMMKLFGIIRNGYLKLTGQSKYLGEQTQYLTSEQMQAEAVAHSLDQVHARLTQRFTVEADAVNNLRNAYLSAAAASERFAFNNPGMMVPQSRQPKRFANGGIVSGPGGPKDDMVPANLSNGEVVLSVNTVKKNPGIVAGLLQGRKIDIPGYAKDPGSVVGGLESLGIGNLKKQLGLFKAPYSVLKQSKTLSWDTLADELVAVTNAAQEALDAVGENADRAAKKIGNLTRKQASHIAPDVSSMDIGGQDIAIKNWRAENLQADLGYVNNYINALQQNKDVLDNFSKSNVDDAAIKLGISVEEVRGEVEKFKAGIHPTTAQAAGVLREIAKTDTGYQAKAAEAGLGVRLSGNYYDTLEQRAYDSALDPRSAQTVERKVSKLRAVLEQRGSQLGKAAVTAVAKGAQTASPSEFTEKVGQNISEGLIVGMNKKAPEVKAAAQRIAQGALDEFEQTSSGLLVPKGSGSSGSKSSPVFLGMPSVPKRQSLRQRISNRFENSKMRANAQAISGGAMKYGMVASGVAMGAAMMPGQVGQFAQSLMPAIMGLQTFAMLLPMLTNPIGLAVAGVAALTAGFLLARKAQDDYVKKLNESAKKEAEIRQGSVGSLQSYGAFIGDGGLPSDRQFNRVGNERFISADKAKLAKFRDFYANQGAGDAAVLKAAKGKGIEQALTATVKDIANRIAVNGLDPADIAANIKAATEQSGANELEVKARLNKIFAPNGDDILSTPLTLDVRMNYLGADVKSVGEQLDLLIPKIKKVSAPSLWDKFKAGFLGDITGAGVGTAMSGIQEKEDKYIANQNNVASVTNTLALNFEKQRQSLALLNAAYVDGTISQEEYNAKHAVTMANFNLLQQSSAKYIKQLNEIDSSGELAGMALEDLANTLLAPFEKTNKKVAGQIKGILKAMPKSVQTEILMNYARGSLTETDILQMDLMLKNLSGKTYEEKIAFIADIPSSEKGLRAMMQLRVEYERLTVLQIEKINQDSINKINRARGGKALNLGASVAYNAQLDKIAGIKKELDKLNKVKPDSPTVNGTTGINDAGSKGNDPYAFIDGLLKRLKEVRKASINATGGTKEFIAQLKGNLTGFKGTEEMLRLGGATEGFIEIMRGIDPADFKILNKKNALYTFGKDGKVVFGELGDAINKFATEIELGDFVNTQQKIKTNAGEQVEAYKKLSEAGVSAAKITEILGNEALTAAVAVEKVGSADWNNFISGAKQADSSVKELAKTLKILAFRNEQEQETSTDRMNEYFAAQEAIIKQQARADFTKLRGYSPEQYEQLIKDQQDIIDGIQEEIDAEQEKNNVRQEEIDRYSRGLELISRQENKINESYDKQFEAIDSQISALEEVVKINDQLIDQQKQQTDLAGALSSGDIGAAAKIAQDMRATAAKNSQETFISNLENQKKNLELKKEQELKNIQVEINGQYYTRTQLQDAIIVKEDEIYLSEQTTLKTLNDKVKVQETILKDMQRIIDKYNNDMTKAINNVTNAAGQTKAEWDSINTVIETTADWLGEEGLLGLTDDLADAALDLEAAWKKVLAAIQEANAAAAGAGGAGGSGGGKNQTTKQPPKPGLNTEQTELLNETSSYIQDLVNDGQIDVAEQATVIMMKELADIKPLASIDIVNARKQALGYLSKGGLVPKYFAAGGFARGTDTVPAMLTPGEFVMSKYAVNAHGVDKMKAINNGSSVGDSVYTYNLSVNVKSDANPNEIAKTVMAQIKQIDLQRLRGVRQ
jgi:TP901 family phage tail tape measure protein